MPLIKRFLLHFRSAQTPAQNECWTYSIQIVNAWRTDGERTTNPQKTDDNSTKNGRTRKQQTINVSNINTFTKWKVSFYYKRKEEPEAVIQEYLVPCNANAMESYRTKRKHNKTECKRNEMECTRNKRAARRNKRNVTRTFLECKRNKMETASNANETGISLVHLWI